MYILGISCFYHDAAATLIKDGKVISAALEERFTRKKHDPSFPSNAVEFCLKSGNISIEDIDYVAFYEKPLLKFERVLSQHLENFPKSYLSFLKTMPSWLKDKLHLRKKLKKLGYKKDVLFIEHHLAHAASAYLPSPFNKAAILTIDGVGEYSTTTLGLGKVNEIKLTDEIVFPNSLGLLYSTITTYLGFKANNSEYKVMGLSAYGNQNKNTNKFYKKLKKVISVKRDSSYSLNMEYFSINTEIKCSQKTLLIY